MPTLSRLNKIDEMSANINQNKKQNKNNNNKKINMQNLKMKKLYSQYWEIMINTNVARHEKHATAEGNRASAEC